MQLPQYIPTRSNEPIYNDNTAQNFGVIDALQLLALIIGVPVSIGLIAISVYVFISGLFH